MADTDKLRDALRNARFEAQRRTDEAGVRDDLDDGVVFNASPKLRKPAKRRQWRKLGDLLKDDR